MKREKRPCHECGGMVYETDHDPDHHKDGCPAREELVRCPVYSSYCAEHGFIHGREAEELRRGIQEILQSNTSEDEWDWKLQDLLDRVDARDSLAYLEKRDEQEEA